MSRLCERPGCSEPGAAAYGMIPEDLLFWIAPIADAVTADPNVLCRRHADAMVVPRGWTLDDRREPLPRLFKPRPAAPSVAATQHAPHDAGTHTPHTKRRRSRSEPQPEQLQIDGTGEIDRPATEPEVAELLPDEPDETSTSTAAQAWQPEFDDADDLGGLLEVTSPLLARAFRGTDRPRG